MKKFAPLIFLAALLLAACGRQEWTPVSVEHGDATLLMPGKPVAGSFKVKTEGGEMEIFSRKVDEGGIGYFLFYHIAPPYGNHGAQDELDRCVRNVGGEVKSVKKIQVNGRDGLDAEVISSKNALITFHCRIVEARGNVYNLTVTTNEKMSETGQRDMEKFFGSLVLK